MNSKPTPGTEEGAPSRTTSTAGVSQQDAAAAVATAPPQDPKTPAVTDTATPPSDLPSATSDFSNCGDIKIGTDDSNHPSFSPLPHDFTLPENVGSSPDFMNDDSSANDDKKPAAAPIQQPSPLNLPSSSPDNFFSSVLNALTPTNPTSFLNHGSGSSRCDIDFSTFDYESLNGIFTTPGGVGGSVAGATLVPFPMHNGQQPALQPQPPVEAFQLPSYIQANLDETYAASTLVFPNGNDDGADGNVFYQVTAYRHIGGNAIQPAAGIPQVSSAAAGYPLVQSAVNYDPSKNKENMPPLPPIKKANVNRPILPLRKRPIHGAAAAAPSQGKKAMIRHNMKEDGEKIMCNCKASKCLKLYCDCFRNGKVCLQENCGCTGCKNTVAHSGKNGIRTKTITEILRRRPDAFDKREKTAEGCKCKKNRCIKKYCVCYNVGVHCDPSKCMCTDCLNYPGARDQEDQEETNEEINDKPPPYVEIQSNSDPVFSATDAAESVLSSFSSSGSSLIDKPIDKRVRHSRRQRNKPQDLNAFYLGDPEFFPVHQTQEVEVAKTAEAGV